MLNFKIALAQVNPHLGAFAENAQRILEQVHRAQSQACDLVVFPEATLFGYHPMDLLERPGVVEAQMKELHRLEKRIPKNIGVFIGAIVPNSKKKGKAYFNAALFLQGGKKSKVFPKQLLPTYDIFDESRHIEPGLVKDNVFKFKGKKLLVTICEDIWAWSGPLSPASARYGENPLTQVKSKDVDLVINLSASPFTDEKLKMRQFVVKTTATHFKAPMVYVNMVGGQDEMIFDGGSYAVDSKGKILLQCQRFVEDFRILDLAEGQAQKGNLAHLPKPLVEQRRQAIVLGLRDFVHKTGFSKVHLGLSGGIDSAVVASLAVEALGPDNVVALTLPGPFTDPQGLQAAHQLAKNLKMACHEIPIEDTFQVKMTSLERAFGSIPFGLVQENLQARLRAVLLMAYSNHQGSLLLNTSNKSELAMGYSTLYGDLCGGLCPIGDLVKGEVLELAHYYNRDREVIPPFIIQRPPSAELAPGQKDEDSLPPYPQLDRAVEKLVEGYRSPKGALDQKVLRAMMASEFKRWQAPPILKLSGHSFGRGRRFPIAHKAIY